MRSADIRICISLLLGAGPALAAAVAKWAMQVKRSFTPAELDDVAEYLNQSHYHVAR